MKVFHIWILANILDTCSLERRGLLEDGDEHWRALIGLNPASAAVGLCVKLKSLGYPNLAFGVIDLSFRCTPCKYRKAKLADV